ncbi:MAG: NAD-dependent succinate-semialdehyde dehydrogenase [Candidatus Buchananbacteria bacterium]|nr:NAD-dependent succinate-semialdehyde dehydrogenase [Candidatus Buchananbacteria bacterium]
MALQSINPATEEIFSKTEELTNEQIKEKITLADHTFAKWRTTTFEDRAKLINEVAKILRSEAQTIGEIMTKEMGKPIKQAIAEVEKCAWVCEYYAKEAPKFLTPEKITTDASESLVRYDPIGIVLAIMPWNFPFWQVIRFAAPALMAGNVGLLKHASNVQLAAKKIEEIFLRAGIPVGVFQNLAISSGKVETIIRDPRVKAVTLTGSEHAGAKVAALAASEIKKSVLELGGSDPFIVLEDADIANACSVAVTARNINNGQSCIAAKRFIVVSSVAEEFKKLFKEKFEALKIGDPMAETTDIGPVVNKQALEELENQIKKSVAAGAKILTGGKRVGNTGYFLQPTILTEVAPGMPAYHEEFFGPVASVIVVKDEAEAVQVANDTHFGLGASIWTSNISRAKQLIPQIDAGAVFVNGLVKSDPRLPFGGEKRSGFGRELSHHGIKEFVNIKSVWIK